MGQVSVPSFEEMSKDKPATTPEAASTSEKTEAPAENSTTVPESTKEEK